MTTKKAEQTETRHPDTLIDNAINQLMLVKGKLQTRKLRERVEEAVWEIGAEGVDRAALTEALVSKLHASEADGRFWKTEYGRLLSLLNDSLNAFWKRTGRSKRGMLRTDGEARRSVVNMITTAFPRFIGKLSEEVGRDLWIDFDELERECYEGGGWDIDQQYPGNKKHEDRKKKRGE